MWQAWVIAILAVILPIAGLIGFGSRLLLWWYLREVRRVPIPAAPDEAIVTYPLA